jgi:hypothetical protein
VLGGASEREESVLEAINRWGRTIDCATTILPVLSPSSDGDSVRGAIILMQDGPPSGSNGDRRGDQGAG